MMTGQKVFFKLQKLRIYWNNSLGPCVLLQTRNDKVKAICPMNQMSYFQALDFNKSCNPPKLKHVYGQLPQGCKVTAFFLKDHSLEKVMQLVRLESLNATMQWIQIVK